MEARTGSGRRTNPWRIAAWGIAAAILLLPLFAMQFTDEVDWDGTDFIAFGAMMIAVGGSFELAVRKSDNVAYRIGAGVAIAAAFLLVWVNVAVGFLGSEDNPANLMFLGVLTVAIIGANFARSRPAGMARAMLATAAAQGLAGAIGLAAGWASPGPEGLYEVVLGTGLFGTLWLASAWLFGKADRAPTPMGAAM